MKELLMKSLSPVIEKFVDEFLLKFDDIPKIKRDLINQEKRLIDIAAEKESELLAIKRKEQNMYYDYTKKLDALNRDREVLKQSETVIIEKTNKLVIEQAKIDKLIAETQTAYLIAKYNEEMARRDKEQAEALKKKYETKLELLKADEDKLARKEKALQDRENKTILRESVVERKEAENAKTALDLSSRRSKIEQREEHIRKYVEVK